MCWSPLPSNGRRARRAAPVQAEAGALSDSSSRSSTTPHRSGSRPSQTRPAPPRRTWVGRRGRKRCRATRTAAAAATGAGRGANRGRDGPVSSSARFAPHHVGDNRTYNYPLPCRRCPWPSAAPTRGRTALEEAPRQPLRSAGARVPRAAVALDLVRRAVPPRRVDALGRCQGRVRLGREVNEAELLPLVYRQAGKARAESAAAAHVQLRADYAVVSSVSPSDGSGWSYHTTFG